MISMAVLILCVASCTGTYSDSEPELSGWTSTIPKESIDLIESNLYKAFCDFDCSISLYEYEEGVNATIRMTAMDGQLFADFVVIAVSTLYNALKETDAKLQELKVVFFITDSGIDEADATISWTTSNLATGVLLDLSDDYIKKEATTKDIIERYGLTGIKSGLAS